jgi:hypothetical protein
MILTGPDALYHTACVIHKKTGSERLRFKKYLKRFLSQPNSKTVCSLPLKSCAGILGMFRKEHQLKEHMEEKVLFIYKNDLLKQKSIYLEYEK